MLVVQVDESPGAAGEAAVPAVPDHGGPTLRRGPHPGLAAQCQRLAAVADRMGHRRCVTTDLGGGGRVQRGPVDHAGAIGTEDQVHEVTVGANGVSVAGVGEADSDHVHEGVGPASRPGLRPGGVSS